MKFNGITIVSDMDGTLLTRDKKISNENKKAIEYFKKNGGSFTIASGRIYPKITMFADELNLNIPIIASNGSIIYDYENKKILTKKLLDNKVFKVIEEIMNKYLDYGFEVAGVDEVFFLRDNEAVQKHIRDEEFTNRKWINLSDIDFEMTKFLIAHTPDKISVIEKELSCVYSNYSLFRSDDYYFEVIPLNVSKGSALNDLRGILGNKATKIYSVGDNMNDLELIKEADVGVAMKNAHPDLKKNADFILPYTNDESGIAKLIELIEKGRI